MSTDAYKDTTTKYTKSLYIVRLSVSESERAEGCYVDKCFAVVQGAHGSCHY